MAETKMQHWRRRGAELSKHTKAGLCARYRELGGLGGKYPLEKWRKDEVINSIVEMEWDRLPEDRKLPDPPRLTPPCDVCGKGQNATAHRVGGDHNYTNTFDQDQQWVPESEAEAERLEQLAMANPTGTAPDIAWAYVYLLERLDQDPPRMLTYGCQMAPAEWLKTIEDVAAFQATQTRVGHSYYGPLRVRVWAHRGDTEHYRNPPPEDAWTIDLPATYALRVAAQCDRWGASAARQILAGDTKKGDNQ